jgi:tetratricopeptide (TPR) repeat protein
MPGRNERCPCGSGKKYKRCCLEADEEAERAARAAEQDDEDCQCEECLTLDAVMELSDEAAQRIVDGRLGEAEEICRQLIDEYPDFFDGRERLAQVYEARGERKAAAEQYRQAAAIAATMPPELADLELQARLRERARELESETPAA